MKTLQGIQDVFSVKVSPDKLKAEICYNATSQQDPGEFKWSTEDIISFLNIQKISYGLIHSNIETLAKYGFSSNFPLLIANGRQVEHGEDGIMKYTYDATTAVDRSEGYDFREVMRIPTVQSGDKIAVQTNPTSGTNGRTVHNTIIKAKPGMPANIKSGQNVTFDKATTTFYASKAGQVNIAHRTIHVHDVYEVTDNLTLKIGNIDFLGTVIIHGDIPTGFRIKATGDIKVYGIVEGAELNAGGSIYVAEGMAGLKQGYIAAQEDVHIGYINQGNVKAGNSIYVDHSILHSECEAAKIIKCKEGNIIGGALSAGQSVISYDIGNRANTETSLSLGANQALYNHQRTLEKEKNTEEDNLRKLTILKQKLEKEQDLDAKTRITLLKLRNSFEQTNEKIQAIEAELASMLTDLGDMDNALLRVEGTVYPNTIVVFGKYRRQLKKKYENVTIFMKNNEISII